VTDSIIIDKKLYGVYSNTNAIVENTLITLHATNNIQITSLYDVYVNQVGGQSQTIYNNNIYVTADEGYISIGSLANITDNLSIRNVLDTGNDIALDAGSTSYIHVNQMSIQGESHVYLSAKEISIGAMTAFDANEHITIRTDGLLGDITISDLAATNNPDITLESHSILITAHNNPSIGESSILLNHVTLEGGSSYADHAGITIYDNDLRIVNMDVLSHNALIDLEGVKPTEAHPVNVSLDHINLNALSLASDALRINLDSLGLSNQSQLVFTTSGAAYDETILIKDTGVANTSLNIQLEHVHLSGTALLIFDPTYHYLSITGFTLGPPGPP
jgi:hypothetical protein